MTTTTPTTGTVLPLPPATDYRTAGRKAATLDRLAGAGFPVPPGVVVPAAVMERATSGDGEVPGEVATALLDAVRAWGDVPLAVRSSGVEEDGSDASYAGLFTSVLDVRGDKALLDAVRACWNSAFDSRVTSSRNRSRHSWPSSCSRWCRPPPPVWRSLPTRSPAIAAA